MSIKCKRTLSEFVRKMGKEELQSYLAYIKLQLAKLYEKGELFTFPLMA